MTYASFDEYLMTKCMEQIPATDDMYPDIYEDWIVEQDIDTIIAWANVYGAEKALEGARKVEKIYYDSVPNLQEALK